MLVAGSQRRLKSCPGLDSKARALMHRMAADLPLGWQIDLEDVGNEHGSPESSPATHAFPPPWRYAPGPAIAMGLTATTSPTFFGILISTRASHALTPGPSSDQSIGWANLEFQIAVRSAGLPERRQSSAGFDPEKRYALGSSSRTFTPVERTEPESPRGPVRGFFLLWRSWGGRSGCDWATEDFDAQGVV